LAARETSLPRRPFPLSRSRRAGAALLGLCLAAASACVGGKSGLDPSGEHIFAPEVRGWAVPANPAAIPGVDVEWQFPAPSISPAGTRRLLTTTVARRSNHVPYAGWRVRYEILSGPPAGFAPDGAQAVEVPTNAAGQAVAEILQKQPCHGCNQVSVQIIRPVEVPDSGGQATVVAQGAVTTTWTAADLCLCVVGPACVAVGGTLNYRIELSNPGDLPAKDVLASDVVPQGLSFLGSNPPAELAGRQLRWRLGDLGARQQRVIDAQFRADAAGCIANRCEAAAAGGLKAGGSATTAIGAPAAGPPAAAPLAAGPARPALDVRVAGPDQAAVGGKAVFEITLCNYAATPLEKLRIRVQLDPGLEHNQANEQNAIMVTLSALGPGQSTKRKLTVGVARPGRLCLFVDVTGPAVAPARAETCVTAVEEEHNPLRSAPAPVMPPAGGGGPEQPAPSPSPAPAVSVRKAGPRQRHVGEEALFTIDLTNPGATEIHNIRVVDRYDPALSPDKATDGFRLDEDAITWTIDLPPGRPTRLSVRCACQTASAKTCNRVVAILPDGNRIEDETCLEILPAEGPPPPAVPPRPLSIPSAAGDLGFSVIGLHNPVKAGKELRYEIRVVNKGTVGYQDICVTATLPDGMMPVALGTVGPSGAKSYIEGQKVRFDPIEVAAGGSWTFDVRAIAKQPGRRRVVAELTAPGLGEPQRQETITEVIDGRFP
jgi:uncharacterized repeat protein (TIGR01451 family)